MFARLTVQQSQAGGALAALTVFPAVVDRLRQMMQEFALRRMRGTKLADDHEVP
jgi:hypothetical protein